MDFHQSENSPTEQLETLMVNCQTAMKEIHYLTALNDPEENQKMISKLP